jgi:outer membrane immunogenic protein
MRNILLLSTIAFATITARPCPAQDMSGLRLGATIGYDRSNRNDNYDSLPKDLAGVRLGGTVGYDVPIGTKLTVGAHAGIGWVLGGRERSSFSGDTLASKPGRDIELLGRIGLVLGPKTLLSASLGYARSTVKSRLKVYDPSAPGGYEVAHYSAQRSGARAGIGLEQRLVGGLSLTGEYRYTDYNNEKGYNVYNDRHQLLVGFALRL